ncbi:hypothetical protein WME91_19680 [Sorangium sp. So ce269]
MHLAHLSKRGVRDTYALAERNTYHPLYISHGHLREVMNPELADDEKTTPAWAIQAVRRTGGMFGLRTAHDQTRAYTRSGVENNCQGSSRSFAQAYEFGRQGLKVPMAFGADLNGFIQQTRPRFGSNGACSASPTRRCDRDAGRPPIAACAGRGRSVGIVNRRRIDPGVRSQRGRRLRRLRASSGASR